MEGLGIQRSAMGIGGCWGSFWSLLMCRTSLLFASKMSSVICFAAEFRA